MTSLAAVHIARRRAGLEGDDWRAFLGHVAGVASSKELDAAGRRRVVAELDRRAGKPAGETSRADRASGPYAAKLQALWIAAHNLGIVRDRRDSAMIAFVRRQTGLDHTRFLVAAGDARKAIEALKRWIAREAGVDWSPPGPIFIGHPIDDDRARIVAAQGRRLMALGAFTPFAGDDPTPDIFLSYAPRVTGKAAPRFYDDADWIALMNALGRRIRAAEAAKGAAGSPP